MSRLSPLRSRREVLGGGIAITVGAASARAGSTPVFRFGLTPVFLTSDLDLLTKLRRYLARQLGQDVELVQRRTYEEITSLLVSGQISAAWICGYPFVAYRSQLELVAVPVWKGRPYYQSYLIERQGRGLSKLDELRGDVHAFSDPNSNSGYLVTAAMLAAQRLQPRDFFRQTFFTYGHRNVVRAVASGLAQSGSVDGYVWEVMREIESDLTARTEIVHRSEWLGFPPIACPKPLAQSDPIVRLRDALVGMTRDADGRDVLALLRLDGFAEEEASIFDAIAAKIELIRSFG